MKNFPFKGIGDRLKKIRGDLSQVKFAKSLDIKQQQYNRYEKGHNKPPLEILEKISTSRNLSIDWILTGDIRFLEKQLEDLDLKVKSFDPELYELIKYIEDTLNKKGVPVPTNIAKFIKTASFLKNSGINIEKFLQNTFTYNNVREDTEDELEISEPEGTPYDAWPELTRMQAQVNRIYKGKDKTMLDKLRGFLAAADPGEKEEVVEEIKKNTA